MPIVKTPLAPHTAQRCRVFRELHVLLSLLFLLGAITPGPAVGQLRLPPAIDPSGRSGELPEIQKKEPLRPAPPPTEILPPVQPSPLEERKEKGPVLRVFVKKINVVGSTVFSQEELAQVTAPYENREVSTEDLEELRRLITLMYVNKGYANSGAVIPEQAVTEGVVTIQVIEGQLSEIRIEGNKWFRTSYLRDRIELSTQPPFGLRRGCGNVGQVTLSVYSCRTQKPAVT